MRLAEDVLGILDELRNTPGTLKRARIIGRLWSAARQLPSDERKELASVLADRYAPKLAESLAQGRDIQSAELLSMIRTVRSVDASEITEIMQEIQDPQARRALLSEVAESLEDDLDDADLTELVDDPAARFAAVREAAAELAEDLDVLPPDDAPLPTEPPPETTEDAAALEPPAHHPPHPPVPPVSTAGFDDMSEPAVGGDEGSRTDDGPHPRPLDATAGESAAGALEPDTASSADATAAPSPPLVPGGSVPPPGCGQRDESPPGPTGTGVRTEPDPTALISPTELAAMESPLRRLRTLTARVVVTPTADEAVELARAFPDGWQRRRAVASLCRSMPAGAARTDSLEVAAALLTTLGRESDRRWIRRTVGHDWTLGDADMAYLAESGSSTGARPGSGR